MGRAPIPGPQRVSAHVVSKAKPYPAADDDASTAIAGGQWEDEASTTIEHGQVANKLAPLPPTKPGAPSPALLHGANGNITQTGAGLDEHTVDDQHAREVLSAITPIRPEAVARLIVTAGNDTGREVEIRPGKTYTIGRGIDNDVVLTDISVSRKHFDLKHEDGAWVIVDRGSGNGTVVNGNLEDNPFMLATGDVIEIGNTVFRFDQPNGAPRESAATYDLEDEELSTVAGKPVREEDAPPAPPRRTGARSVPPLPAPLPPIAPLAPVPPMRTTAASQPPPLSHFAAQAQSPFAATLGPPQPASTMPMAQMANRPPMMGPGAQTIVGDSMGMPMHGQPGPQMLGQTLQGQQPARPSFPYPQAMEIPPHSVHAQMLIQQSGARRGDGSTAHVAPVPYNPMAMGVPQRAYGASGISRRTKLLIGGIALAVLTGVVTAAIVKSGETPKPSASAKADKPTGKGKATPDPKTAKATTPTDKGTKPTVEPIKDTPKQEPKVATVTPPTPGQTGQPVPTQDKVVTPEPVKIAPKVEPKDEVKVVKQEKAEPKVVKQEKSEPQRESRDKRRESRPSGSSSSKRVATVDTDAAEEKADELYRNRNFSGAARVLSDAAKRVDEDEAKQLRLKSEKYLQLGKTYAQGTAPAAKANVAYEFLQQASNYDRNLGNAFDADIQQKLAAVAPKAAIAWFAQQQYAKARSALITAQRLGSNDANLPIVKQKLEGVARDLYEEAAKEMSSNPTSAKEKLRQVKSYVDAKSQWAVKADALLKKS